VTARIRTGAGPTSIAVLPDGRRAVVTDFDEGTVRWLTVGTVG
jgi:serine/threonine-protein kinase